jgi:hypothetical protein
MSIKRLSQFLLLFISFTASKTLNAQGLEGIVVERYYESDAADANNASSNGSVAPLTVGSITYRVYVDMAEGYKFSQIYGTAEHNLLVNTSTNFFNDPNYGVTLNPATISTTNIRKHTAMIDSWFTTGGTANSKVGVMKIEDPDGTLGNQQNVLANDPGECIGLPINGLQGQDGMMPSSPTTFLVPNQLGLGSALQALDQTIGNSILIDNGAIAALGGIVGPTASNRVLIAQFTTNGDLTFELNVQIVNIASGAAENYVASNPNASELTHPSLIRGVNVAPTVAISFPLDNVNVNTGSNIVIVADVNDPNGTLITVEFFVDGISIGVDNSAPYTANYIAVEGNHTITATATDPDCAFGNSVPVDIVVSSNQPPSVSLTAPSSVIAGSSATFSATASDSDGSVTQVEFFINNISIGIDNTAPYSIDYVPSAGTGQSVKAVATDNLNSSTTSNIVIMDVIQNTAPSVSISSPEQGSAFIAPAEITITANATDGDGSVVQVEFFVNGNSIGLDNIAPFSMNWTSVSGNASITATATDNNGATTTSQPVSIQIVDPNALPYYIGSQTINCDDGLFCIPFGVSITSPVDNIIGYDITINYDPTLLEPTGNVTLSNILADPQFIEVTTSIPNSGTLNITINFNGGSPDQNQFVGSGQLFCIEFDKLALFPAEGQSEITSSSIIESYISGVIEQLGSAGFAYTVINTSYEANLEFWSDSSPIVYDSSNPNDYLVTRIYGASNGIVNTTSFAVPDLNGQFNHDLLTGTELSIERDINNIYTVQPLINAADAVLCKSLATGEFTPSVYQIIAMDVNLDGVVSAGDITQLKQRATLAIGEFQQAWNYDDNGNSNGEPSKDWLFIDNSTVANNPGYQISSTFPSDDGAGYSALRVPVIPFTLPANVNNFDPTGESCADIVPETYTAILLGDINGSYASYQADGQLKTGSQDYILVDLEEAFIQENMVSVPVYIKSNKTMNSIDLALKTASQNIQSALLKNIQSGLEGSNYSNQADQTIRASYFNLMEINKNAPSFYIEFETENVEVKSKDIVETFGLLNGEMAEVIFKEKITEATLENALFPVPNNGLFNFIANESGVASIYNSYGQMVENALIINKGLNTIQLNSPMSGVFTLVFKNAIENSQYQFVIQK